MISSSIIQKSQLEGDHRLDAEYYCSSSIFNCEFVLGKEIAQYIQYGTSEELNEERVGFPVLRLNEFDECFIGQPSKCCNKINIETFNKLKLKRGDVLVCRTNGNPKLVGKSAVVMEDAGVAFASYLFRIKTKSEIISPTCLVTFVNSKKGREQIEKHLMPSIQSNFSPAKFRDIKIPLFTKHFQVQIDKLVQSAYEGKNKARELFTQAENLLLEELGVKGHQVKDEIASVVKLSEVKEAGRIDAEYFQPKYEIAFRAIKKCRAVALGDLAAMKKGFEPGSNAYCDEGKLFLRVSSISKYGVEGKDQKYVNDALYQRLKNDYEPKTGEILLTKDAVPGVAYVVKERLESIISSGILKLKVRGDVEPEYLALCINSRLGQMQVERDAGGSVISHWKPEQVKEMLIPILSKALQNKIADLVKKSHEARKKSKELLEEAKGRVEEMIEKGG